MTSPSPKDGKMDGGWTPGPWWVCNEDMVLSHDGDVAEVFAPRGKTLKGNANLVANAPALLAAAESALKLIEKGAPGWGVAKDILRAAIHRARSTDGGGE